MNRIFIAGAGFPQLSLLREARELGLFVVSCDMNPDAVGRPLAHGFEPISTRDTSRMAEFARAERVDGVTSTGSEVSVRSAARVAALLGLPFYVDEPTLRRCQDKEAMRRAYEKAGLLALPYVTTHTWEHALAFAETHGYPLVVKPREGWGQRGVSRADSKEELEVAFRDALEVTTFGDPGVLVEPFFSGSEYSVNGWVSRGDLTAYAVTERVTLPGKRPLGVMLEEVFPSGLSQADEARVVAAAGAAARALGLSEGPCYSQVGFGKQGVFVFETAARLGGGFDAELTRHASGVSLDRRLLGMALGRAEWAGPVHATDKKAAVVIQFGVADPGLVTDISGFSDLRASEGVLDAALFVKPGERVPPLTDSSKRASYLLAHGASRHEARARAKHALSKLRIHVTQEQKP